MTKADTSQVLKPDDARPPGHRATFGQDKPLKLDCGVELGSCTLAYQTYGKLNGCAERLGLDLL